MSFNEETTAVNTHLPCDDCGSSDALSVYSDGHTHCFSCGQTTRGDGGTILPIQNTRPSVEGERPWYPHDHFEETRGISEDLCRRYGIHHHEAYDKRVSRKVPAIVFDIKDQRGQLISQKVRTQPDGLSKMIWKHRGKPGFFGYHMMKGQHTVVITEGEFDAASLQQIIDPRAKGVVCISLPNGAQSAPKAIKGLKLRLGQFKKIILAFDEDQPGREAAEKCARILGDKVHIAKLPAKDGNDCLTKGLNQETLDAVLRAEPYTNTGKETAEESQLLAAFPLNDFTNDDTGLADRVERFHGADIRYCVESGQFAIWDGKRWNFDGDRFLIAWVNAVVEQMTEEVEELAESGAQEEVVKAFRNWIRRCRMAGKPRHVMDKLKERIHLQVEKVVTFDANPYLLSCRNGTIDLRTGELRPHNRDDLLTLYTDVNYDPSAKSERWNKFMSGIMVDQEGNHDPELEAFVKRTLGYCCTADVSQNVLFFATGDGGNGKTTLFEVVRGALGEYASVFDPSLLTGSGNKSYGSSVREMEGLQALRGRRLSVGPEVESANVLKLSRSKQVSGGDTMRASAMYKNSYEFKPTAKLWLLVNHLPAVFDQTNSAWRRLLVVPFNAKFKRGVDANTKLQVELLEDVEAVLAWLIEGSVASMTLLNESGGTDAIGSCKAVADASAEYRSMFDVIGQFIDDRCVIEASAGDYLDDIYTEFVMWCSENGRQPEEKNIFGMRLKERSDGRWLHTRKSLNGGPRKMVCLGLRLGEAKDETDNVTTVIRQGRRNDHY